MLERTDHVAIVSGANRGVGLAVARRLLDAGYRVSAGARDTDALRAALADHHVVAGEDADERVVLHRYDATELGSDEAWVAATVERFGRLDVVVNNAGILDETPLEDLTMEDIDRLVDVNVKAPLRMTQLTLPHLRAGEAGRIVNLSSLSGVRVKGTFAPGYAMTKHAVIALGEATKQLAWDDGVRVTAVCPGFIATDMIEHLGNDPDTIISPDDLAELIATTIALPNSASVAQLNVACLLEPHF
ncbi:MAG: SDR family NAD(P)-dependent oxidoreductase [Actinomycetota bacterium]